jgi:hypothetical protein
MEARMKRSRIVSCIAAAAILSVMSAAFAQTPQKKSDGQTKEPSNTGIVVVPPKTDPEAVTRPPANVDPKMDDATGEVDRKNREKSQEQGKQGGFRNDTQRK